MTNTAENLNIISNYSDLVKNHLPIIMNTHPVMSVILVGGPGSGKTYLMQNTVRKLWAEANNVEPEQVAVLIERCADRDAQEFAGLMLPAKNDKGDVETVSIKPDLLRKIDNLRAGSKDHKGYKYIVVVFDEVMQASEAVQKTTASVFDRKENTLGGWDLGDGLWIVGTGNRRADRSGAKPALGHLRNRVIQFEMQGYCDETVKGWANDFAEPNGVLPSIIDIAIAHAEDGFFTAVPPTDGAYCSFRSLTNASALIATYIERTGNTQISNTMQSLIAATVGESASKIIRDSFDCEGKIPTAEEILNNPESALLPSETGYQCLAGTLALQIAEDENSLDAAVSYITRLRSDLQVQLGVRLINKSAKMGLMLISSKAIDFITSHNDLIQLSKSMEA
mgnify:CR=1 FL=1